MYRITLTKIPLIILIGTILLYFMVARECSINFLGAIVYATFYFAVYSGIKINKIYYKRININKTEASSKLILIIYTLNTVSLFGSILYLNEFVNAFNGFGDLISAGWLIREKMANKEVGNNLFINGIAMLAYPTLFLSLYLMFIGKGTKFVYMSIVPLIITSISQAARAGLILVMLMILSTLIAKYTMSKNEEKIFKIGLQISFILILIFVVGLLYRDNSLGFEYIALSARDYSLGGFMGFNSWMETYDLDWPTWGKYTFASIYLKFVPDGLPIGYYDKYLEICSDGAVINIFSMYRSLMEDFSYPGAIFICFLSGYLIKFSINRIFEGKTYYFPLFLYLMTGLLYSFVAPITQHTSLLIALFSSMFLIKYIKN